VLLPVNQQSCPSPTAVPTIAISIAPQGPAPTPPSSGLKPGLSVLGLNCLGSAPEPFSMGGVFIRFCLKKTAEVTLRIYSSGGGKAIREIKGGEFRPGNSQIFFNALDSQDKPLPPGSYLYEVYAADAEYKAQRQESMNRAPEGRH
jgi:hypothetical protein